MVQSTQYKTGVYFLLKDRKVIYVGKSTRFPLRLAYHNTQLMPYDDVKFIEYDVLMLDAAEVMWIHFFKPEYNIKHNREKVRVDKQTVKLERRRMKFRVMTKKSIVGFGMHRDYRVDDLLIRGKKLEVISMYYKLSHISFHDDLLTELGISPAWRISKPGKDELKFIDFCLAVYPEEFEARNNKIRRKARHNAHVIAKHDQITSFSKSYHRQFNQKS